MFRKGLTGLQWLGIFVLLVLVGSVFFGVVGPLAIFETSAEIDRPESFDVYDDWRTGSIENLECSDGSCESPEWLFTVDGGSADVWSINGDDRLVSGWESNGFRRVESKKDLTGVDFVLGYEFERLSGGGNTDVSNVFLGLTGSSKCSLKNPNMVQTGVGSDGNPNSYEGSGRLVVDHDYLNPDHVTVSVNGEELCEDTIEGETHFFAEVRAEKDSRVESKLWLKSNPYLSVPFVGCQMEEGESLVVMKFTKSEVDGSLGLDDIPYDVSGFCEEHAPVVSRGDGSFEPSAREVYGKIGQGEQIDVRSGEEWILTFIVEDSFGCDGLYSDEFDSCVDNPSDVITSRPELLKNPAAWWNSFEFEQNDSNNLVFEKRRYQEVHFEDSEEFESGSSPDLFLAGEKLSVYTFQNKDLVDSCEFPSLENIELGSKKVKKRVDEFSDECFKTKISYKGEEVVLDNHEKSRVWDGFSLEVDVNGWESAGDGVAEKVYNTRVKLMPDDSLMKVEDKSVPSRILFDSDVGAVLELRNPVGGRGCAVRGLEKGGLQPSSGVNFTVFDMKERVSVVKLPLVSDKLLEREEKVDLCLPYSIGENSERWKVGKGLDLRYEVVSSESELGEEDKRIIEENKDADVFERSIWEKLWDWLVFWK